MLKSLRYILTFPPLIGTYSLGIEKETTIRKAQKIAVLCDFDGTIVDVDIGELVLRKFGKGDWQSLDARLQNGEIRLEQCLFEQYSMIRATREEILKWLAHEKMTIRPNFIRLVEYCRKKGHEFVVTTGGIDFCIAQVLKMNGLYDRVLKIHSGKTSFTNKGLLIQFPTLSKVNSINFKEDLVNHYHDLNFRVAYIGDGSSDYEPAKRADLVFSVEKSKLAEMCLELKIYRIDFSDFEQIIRELEKRTALDSEKT